MELDYSTYELGVFEWMVGGVSVVHRGFRWGFVWGLGWGLGWGLCWGPLGVERVVIHL